VLFVEYQHARSQRGANPATTPFLIYLEVKVKGFSVGKGEHVAVVDPGPKPHPMVGHESRTRARDEAHTAVLNTPSKELAAGTKRIKRGCPLYVVC
jgi:hypothetical protein